MSIRMILNKKSHVSKVSIPLSMLCTTLSRLSLIAGRLRCFDGRLLALKVGCILDNYYFSTDAFVNSQEWTLGHTVPQIKLVGAGPSFSHSCYKGLLGSVNSGKSALVHRYLTGTYLKDESPEGGRFKKEVVLDGMSYLLLIRDEGGAPDEQFSRWIDGAVFVFSLDSEDSFRVVCDYFERLDTFREIHDLPIILVGTQGECPLSNADFS